MLRLTVTPSVGSSAHRTARFLAPRGMTGAPAGYGKTTLVSAWGTAVDLQAAANTTVVVRHA